MRAKANGLSVDTFAVARAIKLDEAMGTDELLTALARRYGVSPAELVRTARRQRETEWRQTMRRHPHLDYRPESGLGTVFDAWLSG